MFCVACGKEIADGATFCLHCGSEQLGVPQQKPSIRKSCDNCGVRWTLFSPSILHGGAVREGEYLFCSKDCRAYFFHPDFCEECYEQTLPQDSGGTYTVNVMFGTRLISYGRKCSTCHSRVVQKWAWFVTPVFPVGALYRVKYTQPGMFISRKLKPAYR